jgi:cell shape-determining protein MreD
MNFLGFIMPLPYLLFIILYPVNGNRSGLLTSFLLGLTMDVFSNSGGYAAACVTLAYFRPYIFKFAFGIMNTKP